MFSQLWGRITGKDKRLQTPDQQVFALGRGGDFIIISPYGVHCDLPSNALVRVISEGVAISMTVDRPDDAAQGEPVFFHPMTNSRVIFRNNGDIDVFATANLNAEVAGNVVANVGGDVDCTAGGDVTVNAGGDFTVNATNINLNASDNSTITTTGTGKLTHNGKNIGDDHIHTGSSTAPTGPVSNTGQPV